MTMKSSGPVRRPPGNDGSDYTARRQASDQTQCDGATKRFRLGARSREEACGQSNGNAGQGANHDPIALAVPR